MPATMLFRRTATSRKPCTSFWFHDHRAAFTAHNNYLGLNGMYLGV